MKTAIVDIAGFQYKVSKDDLIESQRVEAKKDKSVKCDKVLLLKDGNKITVGQPYVKGAFVECELVRDFRGKKVIAYKVRRRKSSESKRGHRQELSLLKVKDIVSE